jgi:hypothetical protein
LIHITSARRFAISLAVVALTSMFAIVAHADPVAEAKAVNDAFA